MSEAIGSAISGLTQFNVNTLMPSLTDNADIQEALRLYHYGAPSGSGVGFYDPTNTNPANLVNPSIAHSLYSLQTQITNVSGSLGVQASTWTAKGALVTATAASTVQVLNIPTPAASYDGYILTMNSGTSTGLSWAAPVVTATNTVTFTNKTLTSPTINGATLSGTLSGAHTISGVTTFTAAPVISTITNTGTLTLPTSTDTLVGRATTDTLTNKTLTSPTINSPTVTQLYLSDSSVIFEGSIADAFETTLGVINPTADRLINLPDTDGTVITTGNLSSITTVGTVTSGTFPAANISGTTLASNVISSSLTSVGTLTNLTVTNPISGSVTGSAGSVAAANISGTTLASNVVSSSLTSVGTLTSLNVTGNVVSHIAFNTSPTGSYTLVTADDGKIVEMASGGTLTVPADGGTFVVPVGTQITVLQTGISQVTLAGSGATVNGTPGLKLRAQWSSAVLIKRAANSWVAIGDLTA